MVIFTKIKGVMPDALAKLHHVMDSEVILSKHELLALGDNKRKGSTVAKHLPFAELLSSKFDDQDKSYAVELKVETLFVDGLADDASVTNQSSITVFPPLSVMKAIYDALGVFPQEEQVREGLTRDLHK